MLVTSTTAVGEVERSWRSTFEDRRGRHAGLRSLGDLAIDNSTRRALGRSLSVFQVGESGTGEHLIAAAMHRGATDDYIESLRCFVKEEQEHARLLALVLDCMARPLRRGHWTEKVFVLARRLHSLRTEVLTLLVAELVALTYYSRLRDASMDPRLAEVFARIHADEVVHVQFHAETMPSHLAGLSRVGRWLAWCGWNVMVLGTSVLVALDHRAALRFSNVSTTDFVSSVMRDRHDLSIRLFSVKDRLRAP